MDNIDVNNLKLLRKGKVKDIYILDDAKLLFKFSDRVSAFDVVLPSNIPRKGEILAKFGSYWFNYLETPNNMLEFIEPNMMVVKKLSLIPIEFVVRGYMYGSLYERVKKGEINVPFKPVFAGELPNPFFDPTTKSETKDVPIKSDEIVEKGILSKNELESLIDLSVKLYLKMKKKAAGVGFIIADLKLEFARDADGQILLADSIGPDEFRLWPAKDYQPGKIQQSFDKQLVRDWLIDAGYKDDLDEARKKGEPVPKPPLLPEDLVSEVTRRYIEAFEALAGRSL